MDKTEQDISFVNAKKKRVEINDLLFIVKSFVCETLTRKDG